MAGQKLAIHEPTAEPAHHRRTSAMPPDPSGTITVICGCMFSGKTTSLLQRLDGFSAHATVTFKHWIDRRYSRDSVIAHSGLARRAVTIRSAGDILHHIRDDTQVIGLDEAHFFDRCLINVTRDLVARGLKVIFTSLDRDSWGRPFTVTEDLCALADQAVIKHALCACCGGIADRTQRLTPIIDGDMVGGCESYEPRCLACWSPPP